MIVVDASVLAAFIRKEPNWEKLADIVKQCVTVDLALKEVLNAVWKDVAVRKVISEDVAAKLRQVLHLMVGINVLVEPGDKYLDKAFEIALKNNITVYDALYIALASEKNLPLATLDERQAAAAKAAGVRVLVPIGYQSTRTS
ncbi:MAG: type II toxin-antitoxin system VapC family toxin [Desulfurococcaceae archaeon]